MSHPPSLILLLAPSDHLFALFLHFPLLLAFSFPAEQKPQQLVCLPACLPSPGSTPSCPLFPPPAPPAVLAVRAGFIYFSVCLGRGQWQFWALAAVFCLEQRAGWPSWPPRNVAGTPRAIFTPLQLLAPAGQSQACLVAPGEPGTHPPCLADPTWPLGPLFPPFPLTSSDLLGLARPASRNTLTWCQYRHQVWALEPGACGPAPGSAFPNPHPGPSRGL